MLLECIRLGLRAIITICGEDAVPSDLTVSERSSFHRSNAPSPQERQTSISRDVIMEPGGDFLFESITIDELLSI